MNKFLSILFAILLVLLPSIIFGAGEEEAAIGEKAF
jgi:hypothetical protein